MQPRDTNRHLTVALLVRLAGSCGWRIGTRSCDGIMYARIETPEGPVEWALNRDAETHFAGLPILESVEDTPSSFSESNERLATVISNIDEITRKMFSMKPAVETSEPTA